MKSKLFAASAVVIGLLAASPAHTGAAPITMDTVPVGNPGNAADLQLFTGPRGAVGRHASSGPARFTRQPSVVPRAAGANAK